MCKSHNIPTRDVNGSVSVRVYGGPETVNEKVESDPEPSRDQFHGSRHGTVKENV